MGNSEFEKIKEIIDGYNPSLIKDLEKDISKELNSLGLFYRLFSRIKNGSSTYEKLLNKNYSNKRKMQDLIGFRIVVYFNDDIILCIKLLKKLFEFVDETIDTPDSSTFKPSRINLIFRLPNQYKIIFESILNQFPIDNTFEVQIRTVFSEGWHEIEHDMRYKCKEEWTDYPDQSRILNGIVATLETCDWSILTLFDELAYKHYQKKNWIQMLKNKFRLRLYDYNLSDSVKEYFNNNINIAKCFFKIDCIFRPHPDTDSGNIRTA